MSSSLTKALIVLGSSALLYGEGVCGILHRLADIELGRFLVWVAVSDLAGHYVRTQL